MNCYVCRGGIYQHYCGVSTIIAEDRTHFCEVTQTDQALGQGSIKMETVRAFKMHIEFMLS